MTYYYLKEGDMFHWHFSCSHVPADVRNNPEWVLAQDKPVNKEECAECKAKDSN